MIRQRHFSRGLHIPWALIMLQKCSHRCSRHTCSLAAVSRLLARGMGLSKLQPTSESAVSARMPVPLAQDSVHVLACADRRRCVLLVRLEFVSQTSLQQCDRTSCVFMSFAIGDHVPWEMMFVHSMCHRRSWYCHTVAVQSPVRYRNQKPF